MSDFVFDLLGGLSVDEWMNDMDRMEEDKKERRQLINDRNIKSLKWSQDH